MIDNHKHIFEVFKKSEFSINSDDIVFCYSKDIEKELSDLNINFLKIREESLTVEKNDLDFYVFEKTIDYLKMNEVVKTGNVLIINKEGIPLSLIDGKTFTNFIEDENNFLFSNSISFNEFIEFIKSQEIDSDEAFHFVDYVNKTNRKIVFTSLSEKGRIIINYYNEIYHFDSKIDYSIPVEEFKSCFSKENLHLPKFLKNSIIEFSSKSKKDIRINELFENLDKIIKDAKINFEIYLNNLSINSIKKEYDEYKSKYFKEISEILSNITQKIIGLPIVIATTLFALEKVQISVQFLSMIIITVLITNVYLVLLLKINFNDLAYIKTVSERDYKKLISNNFFLVFPEEKKYFREIKTRLEERVNQLKNICETYYWIIGLTNTGLNVLIFSKLNLSTELIFIISLISIGVLAFIRNSILEKTEKKHLK
ncbi:hypothetical protein HX004_10740 [Myroides sp. 1354]|uniref:hypothetical protein n=1 Tax=unclassified Myroides TaxID=2642485 RepID=UPI0025774F67|nr:MULTISPECIES: hypothetical protein [unclassified Myroides]MDM1044372.1 hypothetical protein [Myroides sp. R163-1]MDM1056247.1 hypothetical protein [Myroides sp. 1354]MDM1069397.1 hypothetical protein [Myroides sp. 1372]